MSNIQLFKSQGKLEALRASTALEQASQYSPSRWASGIQLSQAYPSMTTPLTAAASDTVERDAQRLQNERLLEDAPRTAAWVVNDPVNAGLALPEIPKMYSIEKGAQWEYGGALVRGGVSGGYTAYYGVTNALSFTSRFGPVSTELSELEFMDRVDSGDLNPHEVQLLEHAGMIGPELDTFRGIDYLRANPAVRKSMREQRERAVDQFVEENPEVFVDLAKAYKSYLEVQREMGLSGAITETRGVDDFFTWMGESVGQLGPQVVGSVALSALTRRPAILTAANVTFAGAQLAGEGIAKALDGDPRKMYDPEVGKGVITAAILGGAIEKFAVPARIAGRLTGDLSDSFADMLYQRVMRRVGANAGIDALSEAMTEVMQETVLDLIILGESATSIEEYIDMAARGAIGGTVVSIASAPFSERRLQRHLESVAEGPRQQERIAQINRTAAALDMRQTAPDRARAYMQSVYQDKQIYVDPVALQRWADDSGSSVEALGVTQEQLDAAAESGNKLAIPLADYAATVPGTDGAKWFEENGTTDANMPSAADVKQGDEIARQLLEEYQRAAEVDATIEEARNTLVAQFEEQIVAAGRSTATASFEARAAAEMILGLARASGDESAALELAQRFGLRVEGPLASQDAGSGAAPGASPSSAPGAVLEQAGQPGQDVTSSPEFADFFRESRVADDAGRPKLVYTGGTADISEFRTPTFFTEHPGEASGYTFASTLAKRDRAERSPKYRVKRGEVEPGRVPYVGIIDDIPSANRGEVWATDQGVVRKNQDGTVDLFEDMVVNYGTSDAAFETIEIKRGDGSREVQGLLNDYNEALDRIAPPGEGVGGNVTPAYLSIQNPLELPAMEANRLGERLGVMTREEILAQVAEWEAQGYDGIITYSDEATMFPEVAADLGGIPKQYIVFRPEQIKSPFNRGTFDPASPRILEQPAIEPVVRLSEEELARVNPIYTGRVPAKKLGSVEKAARWLEGQFQGTPITDFTKPLSQETIQSIGRVMAVEAAAALSKSNNASDWYSGAIERAIGTAAIKWPMLESDEAAAAAGFGTAANARFVFTYIMAVTSQNLPVDFNAEATNTAFDAMVQRVAAGDFTMDPEWGTGDKQKAMAKNFQKFGPLVDAMPGADFPERLANLDALFRQKKTVKEWISSMKAAGVPYSKPGQTAIDAVVYGSSILGPKIGNGFWQNLNGNFDPLTIDLWMRRTWGRLTGKSIGNPGAVAGNKRRLKASIQRAIKSPERDLDALLPVLQEQRDLTRALNALASRTDLTNKDRAAQERALKKQIKELKEVAADLRAAPPPEPWKAVYGKDDAELSKYAQRLLSAWDKTYKELRKKHPNAVPAKLQPTWARAAKRIKADLTMPLDQVANGTQRKQIEAAVLHAQQVLAEQGLSVSVADLQAILWYPEKELWNALSTELEVDEDGDPVIPRSRLNESYDTAFARILRREGYGEEQGAEGAGGGAGGGGALAGDAGAGPGSAGQQGEGLAGRDGQAGDGSAIGAAGASGAAAEGGVGGGAEGAPRTLSQGGLGRYDPLPGAPRGVGGPIPDLVDAAENYAASIGLPYSRQALYVQVDEAFAKRLADAYEEMKHDPSDPAVKAAYEDLARQTRAQYDALVEAGYSFSFFGNDDDPYATSPVAAIRDLRDNKRMAVYATAAGFGVGSTVNIGLADPQGGPDLTPEAVLQKVRAVAEVVEHSVHQSDTEQTLVVKLKHKLTPDAGNTLSAELGQEAIAERFDDETGALHGPMAEQWGPYNPDFFVMPDGKRASEVANPLLADTGLRWTYADGTEERVTVNDLFRAVHDAFGHGLEGAGFRAQGEENAWQAHSRLFHGPALGALTSETRGQNSWLNYGPYGETNRTAGLFDTVFAEQKTGLMPEWTWTENVAPAMPEARTLEQPAMHGTPHPTPFDRFDLSFMGTGEGVQAYGWGLYFATLRGVAEHYRNMRRGMVSPTGEQYDTGVGSGQFGTMLEAMAEDLQSQGIQLTADQIDIMVGDYIDRGNTATMEEFVSGRNYVTGEGDPTPAKDQLLEAARALDSAGWKMEGSGRIYHVDIPSNDELFYYDAPMADQPPAVLDALTIAIDDQIEIANRNNIPDASLDWEALAHRVEDGSATFEEVYDILSELLGPPGGTRRNPAAKSKGDKAASEWLRDVAGVPGHRFLDNKSRVNDLDDPDNTYNFVIYDDAAINIREFEQAQPTGPRANITMPAGALGESVIRLMAGADASSLLHEMGHWWLEAFHTLATHPRAGEAMRRDLAAINRWLGRDADDKTPFTEDQHEQWARVVERYFYEGKAPSRALRRVFKAMASFMSAVYQSAEQLNVEISPEIREVLDRIFASQQALAEARGEVGAGPALNADAAVALGMSRANWEAYSKLAADTEARASAEHIEAAMAEIRKRRAGDYKEKVEEEKAKAEVRLAEEPVYRLIEALGMKGGDFGDGARMDRAEVVELFGEAALGDLTSKRHQVDRNLYITEGAPLEYVAAQFGFANPEQMMQAIRGAQPLEQAAEAEARAIADLLLGEQMTEEAMLREAHAAYHNSSRMELLAYEALALDTDGKVLKGPEARAALLERMRQRASDIVDGMPVAQIINLEALLRAERRAGKEAETALRKVAEGAGAGQFAAAKAAKSRQVLAAAIWNEARKRERQIDRARKLATKMGSKKAQAKIHRTFLPHVLALLERFDFRKSTQPGARELPNLYQLVATLAEQNAGVVPPGFVLQSGIPGGRRPYTLLTGAEMRAVADQLTNLVKLGRDALKEENEQIKNTRAAKAGAIAAGVRQRFGTREVPRSGSERGRLHKMAKTMRGLYAVTRNVFGITRSLDGENDNGAFFQYILKPVQQAAARAEERGEEARKRLTEILEQHYDAKARRNLNAPIMRDEVGLRLSHADVLSLALNAGNDGNWARVLHESNQWDEAGVRALLQNAMTENDWRYVQAVWDNINSYWPEIAALEQKHTGLEPQKVAANLQVAAPPFVRGGYYPIVYDGEMSARIQELEWKTLQDAGLSGHFSKVQTVHGHVETRTGGAGRALQLGLDPMFRHVTQVIRDIEMRDAVIEAHKLLNDRNLVDTMDQAGLREIHHALLAWIKDVAAGEASRTGGINGFAKHIRRNVSLSRMGFSLTTASLQPLGLFQSAELIGWGTLLKGMVKSYSDSRASHEAAARSVIMRGRKRNMDRDMQQILRDARAAPPRTASLEDVQHWVGRYGFWLIQQLQYYVVDVPTWTAVYDRELRRGKSEEDALAIADRMLTEAQGSGSQLDRSAIERGRLDLDPQSGQGHELIRLFTVMGSYMVNKWNRAASRTGQLRRGEIGPLKFAVSMIQLLVLEAAITAALRNALGDDEDEEMLDAVGMKVAQDIVGVVPVAGPIASGFVGGHGGTTAITGYFKDLARALQEAGDAAVDEDYDFDRGALSSLVTALGSTTGAPSVVLNRLIRAVFDEDLRPVDDPASRIIRGQLGGRLE